MRLGGGVLWGWMGVGSRCHARSQIWQVTKKGKNITKCYIFAIFGFLFITPHQTSCWERYVGKSLAVWFPNIRPKGGTARFFANQLRKNGILGVQYFKKYSSRVPWSPFITALSSLNWRPCFVVYWNAKMTARFIKNLVILWSSKNWVNYNFT